MLHGSQILKSGVVDTFLGCEGPQRLHVYAIIILHTGLGAYLKWIQLGRNMIIVYCVCHSAHIPSLPRHSETHKGTSTQYLISVCKYDTRLQEFTGIHLSVAVFLIALHGYEYKLIQGWLWVDKAWMLAGPQIPVLIAVIKQTCLQINDSFPL